MLQPLKMFSRVFRRAVLYGPEEIRAVPPRSAHVLQTKKNGQLLVTGRFLFHLLLSFYEDLNLHALRRKIADLYSANLLAMAASLPGTDVMLWTMSSIPHTPALKALIFHFFRIFVEKRVQLMVDQQILFNGQGLRFDGNFDVARRVALYQDAVCTTQVSL